MLEHLHSIFENMLEQLHCLGLFSNFDYACKIVDQVSESIKVGPNFRKDTGYVCPLGYLCYIGLHKEILNPVQGASMLECDLNLDGEINHEEFVKFIQQLTTDTFIVVSQGLIVTLVVAPTVAMATKKATEGVPGVGKAVQKLPNSIYVSLVTLAIVWFQTSREDI
ncbi:hypothetical protein CRYUN_Cryun05aG0050300 [Craigia yunnanensis]